MSIYLSYLTNALIMLFVFTFLDIMRFGGISISHVLWDTVIYSCVFTCAARALTIIPLILVLLVALFVQEWLYFKVYMVFCGPKVEEPKDPTEE